MTKRPTTGATMPDVQASKDARHIAIDRVGVKDITYPMKLRSQCGGDQHTVATVNMYVSLPHYQKGTHMSRFLEVLNEQTSEPVTPDRIPAITRAICERLNAEVAHFECDFTYFIKKLAPVTQMPGLMDYKVRFECTANGEDDFVMSVAAPAASLCPCSKEISEYGAHNQRCRIEAKVRLDPAKEMLWIEELVEMLGEGRKLPGVRGAQAPRREVRDREGLRESQVRRRHRARSGDPSGRRGPDNLVLDQLGELRVDP